MMTGWFRSAGRAGAKSCGSSTSGTSRKPGHCCRPAAKRPGRPQPIKAAAEKFKDMVRPGTQLVPGSNPGSFSLTLSPMWRMNYGSSGISGRALMNLTRYYQTRDSRFLKRVEEVADRFLEEGIPKAKGDFWPCASGQVISLLVTLSREKTTPTEKARRYMAFA